MEYISFEHNNIAAELVKQFYDTPPLAFVLMGALFFSAMPISSCNLSHFSLIIKENYRKSNGF